MKCCLLEKSTLTVFCRFFMQVLYIASVDTLNIYIFATFCSDPNAKVKILCVYNKKASHCVTIFQLFHTPLGDAAILPIYQ